MSKIIERLRDALAVCLYLILAGCVLVCALVAMWALDALGVYPS